MRAVIAEITAEKASRPDEISATDLMLMYLKVDGVQYYLVTFIDKYSRYLVHWGLLTSLDGHSISTAAQRAMETLPTDANGKLTVTPKIRSDNGSGFISGEFVGLLSHHQLTHHRIRPHCPEENGIQERFNRTLREGIEKHDLESRYESQEGPSGKSMGWLEFSVKENPITRDRLLPTDPRLAATLGRR